MNYVHPVMFASHWLDVYAMILENYEKDLNPNDIIFIGTSCFQGVNELKLEWPDHDKYVVYQVEPLVDTHWHKSDKILQNIEGADEVWDYDLDNIQFLKEKGIEAKFKPFLYTESLKRVQNVDNPDIDVLFYGTLSQNRLETLKIIFEYCICNIVVFKSTLNYKLLDEFVSRSKIILDLHTDDGGIQKQSRIFYSLINDKCVLSERSNFNLFGDLIIQSNADRLAESINFILENDVWKNYSNISSQYKNLSNYIKKFGCSRI